jgi:hypothetical protein
MHKGHHSLVELVRTARSALARHQAGNAVRLERRLGVIERRPGTPEGVGRLRDRVAVDLDPTDHFVFHLDQIPRIEKLVRAKQGVADRVGTGMQGTLGAERLGFRIATGWAGCHSKYNYASIRATVSTPANAGARENLLS